MVYLCLLAEVLFAIFMKIRKNMSVLVNLVIRISKLPQMS